MANQKQIDANRRNARKSTGPTTPEGKARVSINALRHGLTAERSSYKALRALRDSVVHSDSESLCALRGASSR